MDETPKLPEWVLTVLHKVVPTVAGVLIVWLTNKFGLDLTALGVDLQQIIYGLFVVVASIVWYLLWRYLGKWMPILSWLNGFPAYPTKYVSAKTHSLKCKAENRFL